MKLHVELCSGVPPGQTTTHHWISHLEDKGDERRDALLRGDD
jgi:hypothetical protein